MPHAYQHGVHSHNHSPLSSEHYAFLANDPGVRRHQPQHQQHHQPPYHQGLGNGSPTAALLGVKPQPQQQPHYHHKHGAAPPLNLQGVMQNQPNKNPYYANPKLFPSTFESPRPIGIDPHPGVVQAFHQVAPASPARPMIAAKAPATPDAKSSGTGSAYSPTRRARPTEKAAGEPAEKQPAQQPHPQPQPQPPQQTQAQPAQAAFTGPQPQQQQTQQVQPRPHAQPQQPQDQAQPSAADEACVLSPADFTLEAVIGVGAYGKVFKATSRHTGRQFALKVIDKARLRTGKPTVAMLVKEATLLRIIDHPYVLKLHATFQTKEKVFFLTDLLSGGDCFRHEQLRGFNEGEARHLAAQAVLALEYLHSKGILYRDMKPENLSLDAVGNLVLIDMGHGIQQTTATDLAGTPEYMAPEQIYQRPHDHAVDYWGLGITLYELMARRHPFGKATPQHILSLEPPYQFPHPVGRQCIDFLAGLLRKDPRHRLSDPRQIRTHPWFRGLDWQALEKKQPPPPYRPSGTLWQNFDPEFLAMAPVLDASEAGPHIPNFNYEPAAAVVLVKGATIESSPAQSPTPAVFNADGSRPTTPCTPTPYATAVPPSHLTLDAAHWRRGPATQKIITMTA